VRCSQTLGWDILISNNPYRKGIADQSCMNVTQVVSAIDTLVQDALKQRGLPPQPITVDTLLLGSSLGIDSLDLAAIVVQLTEETGKDPFDDGFIDFRTVGELARLYAAFDSQ